MTISTTPVPTLTINELDQLTTHISSGTGTDTINFGDAAGWGSTGSMLGGVVPNVTVNNMGTYSTPGSNGYVYTTTGTSGQWISGSPATVNIEQSGTLELRGKNPDIKINGKSMVTWMEKVEERLNILTPNPELEADWDNLRRLGQRYRALERKCQEKAKMWAELKKIQPQQP